MWGGLYALCPYFVGKVYSVKVRYSANNEVTVQWADLPYPNPKADDGEVQQRETVEAKFIDTELGAMISHSPLVAIPCSDGVTRILHRETKELRDSPISYLTLSENSKLYKADTNEDVLRPGFGMEPRPSKFRKAARHTILEGGQCFTRSLSETHVGYFVTLTLPGSSDDAMDAISKWSGYLVHRSLQRLRKVCPNAIWFYCWELQKRGALHLHLFAALPSEVSGDEVMGEVRSSWYSSMERLSIGSGVDFFSHKDGQFCTIRKYWQSDIQEVEKSPAQYISKYVSKGCNASEPGGITDKAHPRYPSRWWGMSRTLRRMVDEQRFEYNIQALEKQESHTVYDVCNVAVEQYEPIQKYETEGEICNEEDPDQVFGYYKKTTYYFAPEDFPKVQFLVKQFCRELHLVHEPIRYQAKYHAWIYEGDHIDTYLPAEVYL